MNKSIFLIPLILLGCGTSQKPGDSSKVDTGRFEATYQGTFDCGKSDRESKRAIYIITDTKTKKSYLAVQGCGTTELVSESSGKTSHDVER
jgi:hypothetical protein